MTSSALLNAPPQPTKSKESAPEVLSYRQRLYDRETLMLPNEPWNPAARLAQMRDNYDRLVLELGVSPRGGARRSNDPVQLPRVPQSRHWQGGGGSSRKSPTHSGSQSARDRKVGYGKKAKGMGADGVQTARLITKLDAMADSGQLSAAQAKRLRKMWALQEQIAMAAVEGGDQESLLESFHKVLAYLEEPDSTIVPSVDYPPSAAAVSAEGPPAGSAAAVPEADGVPPPIPDGIPPPVPAKSATPPQHVPHPPPPRGKGSAGSHHGAAAAAAPDPEADAAFAKVDNFLHKGAARVSELFRRMDSNLDGLISPAELYAGLVGLECIITEDEVAAFLRKVRTRSDDPNATAAGTTLKQLAKALRPGQSVKSLLKVSEAKEAADAPISPGDMLPDGLTEEEAAQMRAEAHLKAGRLPSLSPDEDDGESPRAKKGGAASGTEFVWNQLEARIAPDGVQAAPVWQREALHRVQWQVDVKRRKDARDAKTGRERANPLIPAWDKPAPPSKKHLLERELRQQRARVGVSEGDGDGVAAAASSAPISFSPRGAATMSSFGGPNMGGSYSGTYSGQPEDLVGENPARMVLGAADPNDTSQAHAVWLKHAAGQHDEGTTSRVNKIAFYEQALQQLTLQRQELDNSTESTKANIDGTQRSGEAPRIDTQLRNEHMRKERLKADLLTVQEKANAMTTSTQALMHVINSLRITRKRHVQRVHGLDVKEKTMDNDAQFLLGSASGAMEERERLRAKHERLKHEASAWRTMQLKEAAELGEKLTELDDETRELETRLHSLDEQATRLHFAGLRDATHSEQQRSLKYGYLRGQVAGWAAEFERVTAITGVRFGEGKSDAVDKVVSIYSANELRNKSLFKYVTEDIEGHKDSLQTELAAEEAAAIALEAEHVAHDAADAAASAKSLESSEAEAHLVHQLERASAGVEAILPLVEKLGLSCMDATSTLLPQHMAGQSLAPPTVPAFLALLEDALHKVLGRATTVVSARAPPVPQTEEEQKAFDLLPPEVVSDTLAILRGAVKARTLAKGKDDGKMMQNESSERLLSMS